MGKERWERFVESLARRMEAGPRLLDEVSRDIVPNAAKPDLSD
jgi:hypothetical protein